MRNAIPPTHLDVKAFAQTGASLSGHALLSTFPRLMQDTQGMGAERLLNWSAQGELRAVDGASGQIWLHLKIDAQLPLTCQRCLDLADIAVTVERSFRFCESEEAAEAQDAEAEEDVLALSSAFSLTELIEDEVLMALPLVPRHDVCPEALKLAVADPGFEAALLEKRQPFAALAKLKDQKTD
jgi:uncharacterized protein